MLRQEEPRRKGLTEIARARELRLRRGDRELTLETDGLRLRGESPKLAMAQVGALLQRSGELALRADQPVGPDLRARPRRARGCGFSLREVAGTFQADRQRARR